MGDLAAPDDRIIPPPDIPSGLPLARRIAPNLFDPKTYQPLPGPSLTPTAEGKLPEASFDPRLYGAMGDIANIGSSFIGGPEIGGIKFAAAAAGLPAVGKAAKAAIRGTEAAGTKMGE
jgi:hypothetical protein